MIYSFHKLVIQDLAKTRDLNIDKVVKGLDEKGVEKEVIYPAVYKTLANIIDQHGDLAISRKAVDIYDGKDVEYNAAEIAQVKEILNNPQFKFNLTFVTRKLIDYIDSIDNAKPETEALAEAPKKTEPIPEAEEVKVVPAKA